MKTQIEITDDISYMRLEILNFLKDVSKELFDEVELGKTLTELNISNSFTDLLDGAIQNPLATSLKGFVALETSIYQMIDIVVKSFLKSKKRLIESAFKSFEGNELHYCIILKQDTITNRGKLYEFLDKYAENNIEHKFPVSFQFIPKNLAEKLTIKERIELQ